MIRIYQINFAKRIFVVFLGCSGLLFGFLHSANASEIRAINNPIVGAADREPVPEISSFEQRLVQEGLVDVRQLDPSIVVDLKYAQANNFMGINVYGDFTRAYLRPQAAWKLVATNQILRRRHPNLLVRKIHTYIRAPEGTIPVK